MNLLPEWAPNVHPMIIHFPIVLALAAVLFDVFALIWRKYDWLRLSALSLYILTALAGLAAYFSGRQAADAVMLPAQANPVLSDHANLAFWLILFYGIYGLVRLGLAWKKLDHKPVFALLAFLVGATGLLFVFETAEHGAELVYKHGVGVKAVTPTEANEQIELKETRNALSFTEGGNWFWQAGVNTAQTLDHNFEWLEGSLQQLGSIQPAAGETGNTASFTVEDTPLLFSTGPRLESVQADVLVNLDQFDGSFMLVHHVRDRSVYDFVELQANSLRLGRVQQGTKKVFETRKISAKNWSLLRVVGDRGHFRAYLNNELVAHGHAADLPPGTVGLRIRGKGRVILDYLKVEALRGVDTMTMPKEMNSHHDEQQMEEHHSGPEEHEHSHQHNY